MFRYSLITAIKYKKTKLTVMDMEDAVEQSDTSSLDLDTVVVKTEVRRTVLRIFWSNPLSVNFNQIKILNCQDEEKDDALGVKGGAIRKPLPKATIRRRNNARIKKMVAPKVIINPCKLLVIY